MTLQRGNLAIASHAHEGNSLFLFRKMSEGLRVLAKWSTKGIIPKKLMIEKENERDAIVFQLRPLSAIVETMEETPKLELRRRSMNSERWRRQQRPSSRALRQRTSEISTNVVRFGPRCRKLRRLQDPCPFCKKRRKPLFRAASYPARQRRPRRSIIRHCPLPELSSTRARW
jgi:5-methylcytosine-specific restriction protein A